MLPTARQIAVVIPAMTNVLARPALKMGSMNTVSKLTGHGTSIPANRGHFPAVRVLNEMLSGKIVGGLLNNSPLEIRLILSTHNSGKRVTKANNTTVT